MKTLASMIARTSFAISMEESRFTLNGALLLMRPEGLTMVATDGHRLAYVQAKPENSGNLEKPFRALVPKKAMAELVKLADEAEDEAMAVFAGDDNHLFFQVGHRLLITRKLTGNFPDYERVLPKDHTLMATLQKDEIRSAIERVAQFADERSRAIRVQFTSGEVRVFSSSVETGESEESVSSEYTGAGSRDRLQCPVSSRFPPRHPPGPGRLRAEGSEERRRNAAGGREHTGSVPLCGHAHEDLNRLSVQARGLCEEAHAEWRAGNGFEPEKYAKRRQ